MRYVETDHIKIADVEAGLEKTNGLISDYIFDTGLKDKDALRLRLLSEEVLRLAKSIIGHGILDFHLEGTSRVSRIILTADNRLDKDQEQELISVSTTGTNASEEGFFGVLKSLFTMRGIEESTWTLKDYQDEIRAKKESDKFSQEAWDDLERSLVANLADDIEVGIDKDQIRMVVTKDFSEALSTVGSRVPEITTKFTFVDSDKIDDGVLFDKADELIEDLELSPRDAIHMKLLFEEVVGMLKALTAKYHAAIWFEKYKHECCIKVSGKTEMSQYKKEGLLEVASEKKNTLVKGFMDKVTDVIENGLLNYENVMKLQQTYGGGVVNYGTMGMYGSTETIGESGIMWSLYEYRDALKDAKGQEGQAQEAWDELEKSIVASIAKDVLVGVKGNRLEMTIVWDIK